MVRTLLSDEVWARIESVLPGKEDDLGRTAADNRWFVEAVLWIGRTGCPWRDLPKKFGRWHTVYMRFSRWRHKGVLERVAHAVSDETEIKRVLIDSTIVRAHQHSAGARKKATRKGSRALAPIRPGATYARSMSWRTCLWLVAPIIAETPMNPPIPFNGPAYTTREFRVGVPLGYVREKLSDAIKATHAAGQAQPEARSHLVHIMYSQTKAFLALNNMLGAANVEDLPERLLNLNRDEINNWITTVVTHGDVLGTGHA